MVKALNALLVVIAVAIPAPVLADSTDPGFGYWSESVGFTAARPVLSAQALHHVPLLATSSSASLGVALGYRGVGLAGVAPFVLGTLHGPFNILGMPWLEGVGWNSAHLADVAMVDVGPAFHLGALRGSVGVSAGLGTVPAWQCYDRCFDIPEGFRTLPAVGGVGELLVEQQDRAIGVRTVVAAAGLTAPWRRDGRPVDTRIEPELYGLVPFTGVPGLLHRAGLRAAMSCAIVGSAAPESGVVHWTVVPRLVIGLTL